MTHSSHLPAQRRLLFAISLAAGLGCFSLEPLSSYSSAGPAVQQAAPSSGEPASEPEAMPTGPAAEPPSEPISEGVPGTGELALEPAMQPEATPTEAMQPEATQPEATPSEPPASEPETAPSCAGPGEFSSADGQTCYRASTQNASWTGAFAGCQMWGGGLAIIDSREEDELIAQHITVSSWIGASDLVQEGRMLWIGGAPVTFGNWAMGQPDDFQGAEDCVVKTTPAGTWNDLPCRNLNAYVCERPEN